MLTIKSRHFTFVNQIANKHNRPLGADSPGFIESQFSGKFAVSEFNTKTESMIFKQPVRPFIQVIYTKHTPLSLSLTLSQFMKNFYVYFNQSFRNSEFSSFRDSEFLRFFLAPNRTIMKQTDSDIEFPHFNKSFMNLSSTQFTYEKSWEILNTMEKVINRFFNQVIYQKQENHHKESSFYTGTPYTLQKLIVFQTGNQLHNVKDETKTLHILQINKHHSFTKDTTFFQSSVLSSIHKKIRNENDDKDSRQIRQQIIKTRKLGNLETRKPKSLEIHHHKGKDSKIHNIVKNILTQYSNISTKQKLEILETRKLINLKSHKLENLEIRNLGILESRNLRISESQNLGILESRNLRTSKSWNLGILESLNLGILESWNLGNSESRNLGISESRNLGISESWNLGNLETRNLGNSESWNLGNLETRNLGNSESWNLGNSLVYTMPTNPVVQQEHVIKNVQEKEVVDIVKKEVHSIMSSSSSSIIMNFSRSDYSRIADQVYSTLVRRLRVERERRGFL